MPSAHGCKQHGDIVLVRSPDTFLTDPCASPSSAAHRMWLWAPSSLLLKCAVAHLPRVKGQNKGAAPPPSS
eukprot:90331-Pelagomonas_calceolata.AAC.1